MDKSFSREKKQVVLLYISSLGGVFLGLLSSIINTRFLDPSNYGDVRFVQNFANLGATILFLGFYISGSRLLALSTDTEEKRNICGALLRILALSALMLVLFLLICSIYYSSNKIISTLFVLSNLLALHLLLNNYITNVTQGDNQIGLLSASRLLPYGLYVIIAFIIYSFYGASSWLMMLLQGGVFLVVTVVITILTKPLFRNFSEIFKKLKNENVKYGNHIYIGSIAMVATTYLAGISIGVFGEDNINVGFYTLALTVTNPLVMLPSIIGTTFFKEFATLVKIPAKVLKGSIVLTMLTCIIFIILIKPIVHFLYSEQYSVVSNYAMLLAVGFSIHGIGDMLGRFLIANGQGKQARNSSIACGTVKLIGYILFVYLWGVNGAIFTTILSDMFYCGGMVYGYTSYTNNSINKNV